MLGVMYGLFLLAGFGYFMKQYYPLFSFTRVPIAEIKKGYHRFFNGILFNSDLELENLSQLKLPNYKMYPELINELLKLFLCYGFNLKEQISGLRSSFKKDIEQEQKLKRIELSALLQFFAISSITWIMILLTSYQAELSYSFIVLMVIFCWQLLGALLFLTIKMKLKQSLFKDINNLIMTLSFWKVLLKTGIPSTEVFKKYPFDWQKNYSKDLKALVSRLEEVIKLTLKSGKPIGQELGYLAEELWYLYHELAQTFENKLSKARLVILALFFLPAYFVFVYFMLDNLAFTI